MGILWLLDTAPVRRFRLGSKMNYIWEIYVCVCFGQFILPLIIEAGDHLNRKHILRDPHMLAHWHRANVCILSGFDTIDTHPVILGAAALSGIWPLISENVFAFAFVSVFAANKYA